MYYKFNSIISKSGVFLVVNMSNSLSNYNKVGKNIIGAPKIQNYFDFLATLENKEKVITIDIAERFPLLFAIALKSEKKRQLYMESNTEETKVKNEAKILRAITIYGK